MTAPRPDDTGEAEVLHEWAVPRVNGQVPVRLVAAAGQTTTIVGPNGPGASALGQWMDQNSGGFDRLRRLIAHRRLWFPHAGPEISPAQRETTGMNMTNWRRQNTSRYLDHADGQRANVVLFDVLARANHENAQRVEMFEMGASVAEVAAEFMPQLLRRLNAIFRAAGLAIKLKLTPRQTLDTVNSRSKSEYPIFQMSDGEKGELLLAAEVLCNSYLALVSVPKAPDGDPNPLTPLTRQQQQSQVTGLRTGYS